MDYVLYKYFVFTLLNLRVLLRNVFSDVRNIYEDLELNDLNRHFHRLTTTVLIFCLNARIPYKITQNNSE
jgi:hypothetical protein